MPQSALPTFPGLDHVVVAGGTPAQWAEMSTSDWTQRLDALAAGVKSSGAHWVTLLPHHGEEFSTEEAVKFSEKLLSTSKVVLEDVGHCERFVWHRTAKALLAPATQDADLVLVLGPPDRMPESMVWELAYCEIVFIDLDWSAFTANHLELAIDDFNRRHRRFGGLDS